MNRALKTGTNLRRAKNNNYDDKYTTNVDALFKNNELNY